MMGGMRSTKQEGPPISAMSVRASVRLNMHSDICHLPISMVEIHKVKKWTTGNGNALKPAVREGVWRVVSEFRTNEHVVDSIAIAIAAVAMSSVDKQTMQEVVFAT